MAAKVELIKNSGLVVNFTKIQIPDGAYLFLGKGNSFVPAVSASKHDLVFDTTEFLRKLAWRTYFNTLEKKSGSTNSMQGVSDNSNNETVNKLYFPSY